MAVKNGYRVIKILSEYYLLGRTIVKKQVDTFAAHTDEDMSDEAKAELENFKQYLKSKYK